MISEIISNKSVSKAPVVQSYTEEEALALIINCGFSVDQYKTLRIGAKERGADIYPNYHRILNAKTLCYPENIVITETSAQVQLQSLLDHTVSRLVNVSQLVLDSINPTLLQKAELLLKWGFDGSSGQSLYKQKFSENEESSDSSLFVTWLVPLQLQTLSADGQLLILWRNKQPSSKRFCRPIRLQFIKETNTVIIKERNYIESCISALTPVIITDPVKITVKCRLSLTMADGKVWSALTGKSTATCHVCGATPKDMNKLDIIYTRPLDDETLQFGVSPLHCWIRCLECLLHISYRIEIKKWQVKTESDKCKLKERKKIVQEDFKNKMGLTIDVPKQGSGTTNDGNTARRFFVNSKLSSEISGVDETLINRFAVILRTISSGFAIDEQKFGTYCYETAQLYVRLYSWYFMPASVHKLLVHGASIISASILPIGLLSEEAQETRNKDCRDIREYHTRKISRIATNEDLFKRLLLSSDPVISSFKQTSVKKADPFPTEVLQLLAAPTLEDR